LSCTVLLLNPGNLKEQESLLTKSFFPIIALIIALNLAIAQAADDTGNDSTAQSSGATESSGTPLEESDSTAVSGEATESSGTPLEESDSTAVSGEATESSGAPLEESDSTAVSGEATESSGTPLEESDSAEIHLPESALSETPVSEPATTASRWKLNGYIKNETAYRYKEPRSITKIRNTASLTAQYSISPRYSFTASGWYYYDLAYDLFDYDTIAARDKRNADEPLAFLFNLGKESDSQGFDLREFYLDMFYDKFDVRVGRQFVVWGVLEGVRIVDEINPVDFRELLTPDLLDVRIPLWMANVNYYRNEGTYQFLWIPDLRFHKPAPPGSEWELLQEVPGTVYPASGIKNSEFGLRLSTNVWDSDLTFSYFYTWDDFPVVFRRSQIDQLQDPEFMPTYTRISMYGSTLSKQIGEYILKGELAYVTDKYFAVIDVDRDGDGFLDNLGEFQRNHIRWGLGVEFNWKGFDISPAVTQWIILDYDEAMVQDEFDTSVNVFIRRDFPQSNILFEFLAIDFINQAELYLNPEWTFRITDRFQVSTGADIFSGRQSQFGVLANPVGQPIVRDQRSQFVGNFHDNDRVYMELKYSF